MRWRDHDPPPVRLLLLVGLVGYLGGYGMAQLAGWTEWLGESAWAGFAGWLGAYLALLLAWRLTRRRRALRRLPSAR